MKSIVIAGAGQAGAEIAVTLRQQGYDGEITLVGAEPHLPYQRPPLSKGFLRGTLGEEMLRIRPQAAYASAGIEVKLGTRVVKIDRAAHRVVLSDGRGLRYDKLALTTGGSPRALGVDVEHHYLHSLDQAASLRSRIRPGTRILIVGGGFIGLEAAATAVGAGAEVTLVEARPRVMARTCPPVVSAFYERVHREHGVDLRTGVSVRGARRLQGGTVVSLSDDTRVSVDLVLAGIGIAPNDTLAADSGLAAHDGVLVNAAARTSDPDIVAAGDCTRQWNGFLGRWIRLESQQNAADQARIASRTLCGLPAERFAVPWFWSDQYDNKLQMAGVARQGDTAVVRGDPAEGSFSVLYLRDGTVLAVDAVNRPRDFAAGRRLVAARAKLSAGEAAQCDIRMETPACQ